MSSPLQLTPEQYRAVTTTGTSLLVSAAAGSGKTAVLAERCAYLVCDAPDDQRCEVDALLVLTFTEAAAAEMRSRIIEAIRRRSLARPEDSRLRRQLALADAAQISTLHAFCLWLIRRWFTELDLDPTATVMDAEEARLLKKEVLENLFASLYATRASPDDLLGARALEDDFRSAGGEGEAPAEPPAIDPSWTPGGRKLAQLGPAFMELVDIYGLGEDRDIAGLVLRLHDFVTSLPDPDHWLTTSVRRLLDAPQGVVLEIARRLGTELRLQLAHTEQLIAVIQRGHTVGHFYANKIISYAQKLRDWETALSAAATGPTDDEIRASINAFKFPGDKAPSLSKGSDAALEAARDKAKDIYGRVRDRLYKKRLRDRFARFSASELLADLQRIAPFVATIVDLTHAFAAAYTQAKRRQNVLDFSDLECFALRLLQDSGSSEQPSAIARSLHQRFAHVLVDEFQDISPIQQEILRLASRECLTDACGNLFTVGDVKQSIYRFRLAEPTLFVKRQRRFADSRGGALISLQSNFRSRPEILEAVNLVFRALMREGLGASVYDESAELRAGRTDIDRTPRVPIELHLIKQRPAPEPDDDDEDDSDGTEMEDADVGAATTSPPHLWSSIEREAYCIGRRIRELFSEGLTVNDAPLQYRHIAILLRATKVNADQVAAVLAAMGIPAHADASGALFSSPEVRDVVAALEVLDNLQQDIPLAGVLRSGIFGDRFNEDELVEIRCVDRGIPFHAAVREYAVRGRDPELKRRVGDLLATIQRHRERTRSVPLADVLWRVYEENGYLAYAMGLPRGLQRRANLFKLHELARQFGTFRRQGLHRFLEFIRSLAEEGEDVAVAPSIGESEDVVRILSIHQAKGLEFPIVFVAGLGTQFNWRDSRGRMLFERESRIGLRAIDSERMLEYPTAAHQLVVDEIERSTREEEMRLLYVAMTRARERLILLGSHAQAEDFSDGYVDNGKPLTAWQIMTAATALDWLLPVLGEAGSGTVRWGEGAQARDLPLFTVRTYGDGEIVGWRLEPPTSAAERAVRQAVARLEALPADEPLAPADAEVEAVLSRLEYTYPHAACTAIRATVAASEFTEPRMPLFEAAEKIRSADFRVPPSKYAPITESAAAQRGIVTHRVLELLDFGVARDATSVTGEVQRLIAAGVLTSEEAQAIDEAALAWFVATPLAGRIRSAGDAYRREFRYLSAEPVSVFDPSAKGEDDRVLVRGIIDGILFDGESLEVVDFKTDAIDEDEVEARAEHYRGQVGLYGRAVEKLWRRPVTRSWLVFLTPRRIVELA